MNVSLVCSDDKRAVITELLSTRHIMVTEDAGICIVEAGFTPPGDRLCILFKDNQLYTMMELFEKPKDQANGKDTIIGRTENDRYQVIPFSGIYYFEARGNYTFCKTDDGVFRVKEKLYELEQIMPGDRFIRTGKSFIVNIAYVTEITPWFGRNLLLKLKNQKNGIEVSRSYVKSFKEFLGI